MNKDYFVVEWDSSGNKNNVMILRTEEEVFQYIQNSKDKLYSLYEAKCVLDFS